MNIIRDPETGFYNSCHAGTHAVGPRRGLISFVTPHSHVIMSKYREMGMDTMPIAFVFGVPPAYEIMANFSGLHMDAWGEMEMVGTIMDRDVEMVPCETLDLNVPAQAEIVVEGHVNLKDKFKVGDVTSPSMYHLPHYENLPEVEITAITMRGDRPIYRNHQTCPDTDHQPLPRLCHEAVLYNRLSEIGLDVKDVRFPTWGAALSCILQFGYPREGMVNDALMLAMGAPWLNTKLVVAVSPDTNLDDPGDVYHAIATRCDPARDVIMVPNTRGSPYDPSARPLEGHYPWRIVGKMGIDATVKSRHDPADFERAWPRNWGKVLKTISDYLLKENRHGRHRSAKPKVLFEAEPFIPYVREEDFDPRLKPVVEPYKKRMGFLPNALKLYAYRPEIAETLWKLNSNVMRDPSSTLDQFLKRKLAAVACATNGCAYCTAHSCAMLKKPKEAGFEGWGSAKPSCRTSSPAPTSRRTRWSAPASITCARPPRIRPRCRTRSCSGSSST